MRKKLRKILVVLGVLLVIVLASTFLSYRAARQVPDFYQAAVSSESDQQTAGEEFEAKATTLYSDLKREGEWQTLLTADQINGWLAVDLMEKHPGVLPRGVSEPRVAISPDGLSLGVRAERSGIESIVSIDTEIYLSDPNVVACRIRRARAGLLILPRKKILDKITLAAARLEIPLSWAQVDGDPVALFTLDLIANKDGRAVTVEKLELHDGELYISGSTNLEETLEKGLQQEQPKEAQQAQTSR